MKPRLKCAAIAIALMFVAVPVPTAAASESDEGCYACEMCYPELPCLQCGVMAATSLGGCCGLGNGDTYCVPDYGGFAVNCSSGRACQCGMAGDGCDPLMSGG